MDVCALTKTDLSLRSSLYFSYQLSTMFSPLSPLFLKPTNNKTPRVRRLNMNFRYATY